VRGLSSIYHFASFALMGYFLCSPSGARKEEQGQKAQEEGPGPCCVEGILVDTFRSLILRFDKSRNYSRSNVVCVHINTIGRPCPSLGCHAENMMSCFVISTSA